jgi:hypothetical protein
MGRARRFTSRREIEDAFPKLDADCDLPLDQFNDLLGDYWLPKAEWVRCQLVDEHGRCNEPHGWGWLGELKDGGMVGFMGHDCADRHFRDDPRFAALFAEAAARVGRDIAKNALIKRLGERLSDPALAPTLDAASRKRAALDDQINRIRGLLRPETLRRLMERTKRGNMEVNVKVLYIETEIDEKTKKRRDIVRPQEVRWGVLAGVESLDTRPLNRIGGKLADARTALNQAVASEDQPDKAMKKWAAALESVQPAAGQLYQVEAALVRFLRPENLKLLWLLEKDTFAQIAAVNVALELSLRQRISDEKATATHRAWTQEIRDAHQGFTFEVIT